MLQLQIVQQFLEPLAVLGQVDCVRRGAEDRDALVMQRVGQLQRRLTAELDDNPVQRAVFLLNPQDLHHMLKGQRLEIQPVRGVIVGRHGFGVAVDHDRLVARRGQGVAGMTATIVKLDPLADPVGAAAKDDDLFGSRRAAFAFHVAHRRNFVGGIHVGRLGFEFGGAGVDTLEHCMHAARQTRLADLDLSFAGQGRQTRIGKAHHFQLAQALLGLGQARGPDLGFGLDDFADAGKEPGVKSSGGVDLAIGQPVAHGLGNQAHAVGRLGRDGLDDGGMVLVRKPLARPLSHRRGERRKAVNGDLVKAGQAGFKAGQRFLQGFVDGAADGHNLADRFHRGGQVGCAAGEFFEGEARDLGDDIVDGGFK